MTDPIEIQTSSQPSVIKLRFDHREDRWGHRFVCSFGSSEVDILVSIEGTPEQIWPPSPPLQDVSRHSLEHGAAILCVGMAGKSHWSASYSVESQGSLSSIKSDLACLQKTMAPDAKLGMTYRLDDRWVIKHSNNQQIEVSLADHLIRIDALSSPEIQTTLGVDGSTIEFTPGRISNSPVIATRWGFELKTTR